MNLLEDLNQLRFYQHFKHICDIPHGSGDEKAISDYLVRFADEHGLVCRQDEALNVVIKKEAAEGYENQPAVILQAHMDMVCEKASNSGHDFMKDPIIPREKDGYITADGTTLGADDAAGVAYILAILEDGKMRHPALEAVITASEELGMEGMLKLDASYIEASRMINLDADKEGALFASCAGGTRIQMNLPVDYSPIPESLRPYTLHVRDLAGGHSGVDIHRNRANAILLLARGLELLGKKIDLRVGDFSGGGKMNAIPREASAVLWLEENEASLALSEIERVAGIFSAEYRVSEPGLTLRMESCTRDRRAALSEQSLNNMLAAVFLLPCGVLTFNQHMQGVTDSSCNLGILETSGEKAMFSLLARSNTNSKMDDIVARIKSLGKILRAEVKISGGYPAWEFRGDSALREICAGEFARIYGRAPEIESIHGGLECALMTLKKRDMDMVSFGPTILDAHTVNERVEIASMIRTWKLLTGILENMHA
jgi:dipeptidase D